MGHPKSFIDSFIIAREISLNTYQVIGSVHVDSLSIFNDSLANPNATSYNYKIAIKDTCGAVRPYGSYHKTIHLQYFGAGTLQWSSYEIEGASSPVASYNFYRDDNGTGNFQLLTSLPGSNTSYTDLDYVMNPNAAYRIEMVYANGLVCSPSQFMQHSTESFSSIGYSKSYSNILSLGITSVEEQEFNVHVYPNPTTGLVNVDLPAPKGEIRVYDIQGKLIKQDQVTGQQMQIDLRSFSNGVYHIRIDQDGNTVNRSVMLHR